jgi:glutamine synthetase adenylyltransferase
MKEIEKAHDELSAALENEAAGNDEVRDAAIRMCDALNDHYVRHDTQQKLLTELRETVQSLFETALTLGAAKSPYKTDQEAVDKAAKLLARLRLEDARKGGAS